MTFNLGIIIHAQVIWNGHLWHLYRLWKLCHHNYTYDQKELQQLNDNIMAEVLYTWYVVNITIRKKNNFDGERAWRISPVPPHLQKAQNNSRIQCQTPLIV